MSQVVNLLEILWAYERMKESAILSDGEKQIIRKELFHSLPLAMHSTQSTATRGIVEAHLDPQNLPSIKQDEELIVSPKTQLNVPQGRKKK